LHAREESSHLLLGQRYVEYGDIIDISIVRVGIVAPYKPDRPGAAWRVCDRLYRGAAIRIDIGNIGRCFDGIYVDPMVVAGSEDDGAKDSMMMVRRSSPTE
jgi:hypothetical protein